jgi:hypothetical protein
MRWVFVTLMCSVLACGQGSVSPPSAPDADQDEVAVEPDVTEVAEAADVVAELPVAEVQTSPDVQRPVPSRPASRPAETFLPPVARLIAIGDVHGDIAALRAALSLAQVIDDDDHWVGGETTVVQVGDQLDRGEDEREILHWLEDLAEEARAAGGAVYPLLGNHETMNVELDLRYVTMGGFADFADVPWDESDPLYSEYPESERGRVAAFRPGGTYAELVSRHFISVVVGDTVLVHGGILPEHAAYGLDAINEETATWMRGEAPEPGIVASGDGPVWSRHYSSSPDADDCLLLFDTLDALGAERMVVAHTVQYGGITDACASRVWRVDVGLAAYYGGATQVLLIEDGIVSVLP